jgi:hypothetical protein
VVAGLTNNNRLLSLWKQESKLLELGNKLFQPVFKSFSGKVDEEMKCHCWEKL